WGRVGAAGGGGGWAAGDGVRVVEGQGYASGVRDATNLGWKLARVGRGLADSRLLETYTGERRAHARSMIHLSEVAGDIFAPTTRFGARFRDTFVRALNLFPMVKRYFVELRFKPMPRYEAVAVLLPAHACRHGLFSRVPARTCNSSPARPPRPMPVNRASFSRRPPHRPHPFAPAPS
ncbi:3-(3-hydroxyphenyl)propionate hydroxylase, partial [Burkholderia contaminans]